MLLAACTTTPRPSTPTRPAPSPAAGPTSPGTNPLCDYPPEKPVPAPSSPAVSPLIAAISEQVEAVRGLTFVHPVAPEAAAPATVARLLRTAADASLPADLEARRARAWETIGVIPPSTDLRRALLSYFTTQIIGFYDTLSHTLVFEGSAAPTPFERMTLAHELTHALDDQRFDLSREDHLALTCQDDRADAFSSLAEGDAVETSVRWSASNLTPVQRAELQLEAGSHPPPPASIPAFVLQMEGFPYPNGQRFVEALLARGGEPAVDAAFRNPSVSIEQILYPDRYPGDRPVPVSVSDLSTALGPGWRLTDQMDAGEGFLQVMLRLRLSSTEADDAAAGWGGGRYRAWSDGPAEAVLLETVWDTGGDATAFGAAMRAWLGAAVARVEQRGLAVNVLFGSDAPTLRRLEAAAG